MAVPIGSIIRHHCKSHNIKNKDLAKMLGITNDGVYKMFSSTNFKTEGLLKVSRMLKHDFFRYYQNHLEPNVYGEKQKLHDENLRLQKENHELMLENELLKKVLNLTKAGS